MGKLHHGHPMEVHHPKEHGKKSWLTYPFEFFMMFLAVFCGFLAEYQLEHKIERDREKEFIASMVKEIQLDLKDIKTTEKDSIRYKYLDSLAIIIFGGDRSLGTIKKIYEMYFTYATYYHYYLFERFTLDQLKYAGNMRLIRNQKVTDRLITLGGLLSNLRDQEMDYRHYMIDNMKVGARIMDRSSFVKDGKSIPMKEALKNAKTLSFLTNDRQTLMEFGNNIRFQSTILKTYHKKLNAIGVYSDSTVMILKKEYHLKNE
jgi:hypothetical protein